MKKHFVTGLAGLLIACNVSAQDCSNYLYLQKNKTIENTIYNRKGDANGKQVYTITDVASDGGVTTSHLTTEVFDRKDKSLAKANSTVRCNGGIMMIDMKMMLPQQQQEQLGNNMEAKAEDVYIEYPASMKTGDELKEGTMTVALNNGPAQNMTMRLYDRKVVGEEQVTTTGGSWQCFKISYKYKLGIKTGPINIPINFDGTEWYAPGFGVVKTESKYGGTAVTSIK